MTQIAVALDPQNIVVVADRRLTFPDGRVDDDDRCKLVVRGRQFVVAYTGLANMKPPPRGDTALWLLQRLAGENRPVVDFLEQLGDDATAAISNVRHRMGPKTRRLAIVVAGWGEDRLPFIATVSNALCDDGSWAEKARPRFDVRHARLAEPARALCVYGQPMNHAGQVVLERASSAMQQGDPAEVLQTLVSVVRANASQNSLIGSGLLGITLPLELLDAEGGFEVLEHGLIVGESSGPRPRAVYVPADDDTFAVHTPHYVDSRSQIAEVAAYDRALSPEEITRLYEEKRRRFE